MEKSNIIAGAAPGNKYDIAIRTIFFIFFVAAVIVAVSVGLAHMTATAWVFGFIGALAGALVYTTIGKIIIDMIRKDRTRRPSDNLIRLFYVVFFALATVAFLTIGLQRHNTRIWIIAFIASYGAAFIYASIGRLIVTLVRKDPTPDTPTVPNVSAATE